MAEPFYTCCEDGMLSQVPPTDSSGLCPACQPARSAGDGARDLMLAAECVLQIESDTISDADRKRMANLLYRLAGASPSDSETARAAMTSTTAKE